MIIIILIIVIVIIIVTIIVGVVGESPTMLWIMESTGNSQQEPGSGPYPKMDQQNGEDAMNHNCIEIFFL